MDALSKHSRLARKFFGLLLLTLLAASCSKLGDTNFNLGGNGSGYGRNCNGRTCQAQIVAGKTLTIVLDPATSKNATITKPAQHGTALVSPGQNSIPWAVIYTPNDGFVGNDEFAYDLEGGGLATSITYQVTVVADPNNPPAGNGGGSGLTYEAYVGPLMERAACTTCHAAGKNMGTPVYYNVYEQSGYDTFVRWQAVYKGMDGMLNDPNGNQNHVPFPPKFTRAELDKVGQWLLLGAPLN